MVVSLVLGFLAMIVATMGMKCTNCAGDDKVKKARIAMVGGIIFIVAGEPQVQGGPRGLGQAGLASHNLPSFPRSCCLDSLLLEWQSDY